MRTQIIILLAFLVFLFPLCAENDPLTIQGKDVPYCLSYDPNSWEEFTKLAQGTRDFLLRHKEKEIFVVVVSEKLEVPLDIMKKIVLINAMEAGMKQVEMIKSKQISVKEGQAIEMTWKGVYPEIPDSVQYKGIIHTTEKGTVQIFAYALENDMKHNEEIVDHLLDGYCAKEGNHGQAGGENISPDSRPIR